MGQGNMLVSITLQALDMATPTIAKVEGGVERLGGGMDRLSSGAKAVGTGMSVMGAAGVTGLIEAASKAAETGSALYDMSARTGASVETLSRLGYAANQSGTDLGAVETALKKLSIASVDAASGGTGPGADALARLGLSATDATGQLKESGDLLVEVGDKLRGVGSDAERTQLAVALFGRSGTDLIPMMTDASMSLSEFGAEADKLGLTMSSETAGKMDAFGDSLDKLKATAGKAFSELGIAVAPVLQGIVDDIIPIVSNLIAWIEKNPELAESAAKAALGISAVMAAAGPLLVALPGIVSAAGLVSSALGIGGAASAATAAAEGVAAVGTAGAAAGAGLLATLGPIAAVGAALVVMVASIERTRAAWVGARDAAKESIEATERAQNFQSQAAARYGHSDIDAKLQAEVKAAAPTLGERVQGWLSPGITGKQIAEQRVFAGQGSASVVRGYANGGMIAGGEVAVVGEAGPELAIARGGGVEIIPFAKLPGFAGGGFVGTGNPMPIDFASPGGAGENTAIAAYLKAQEMPDAAELKLAAYRQGVIGKQEMYGAWGDRPGEGRGVRRAAPAVFPQVRVQAQPLGASGVSRGFPFGGNDFGGDGAAISLANARANPVAAFADWRRENPEGYGKMGFKDFLSSIGGGNGIGIGASGGGRHVGVGGAGLERPAYRENADGGVGGRTVVVNVYGAMNGEAGMREVAQKVFEEEERAAGYRGRAVAAAN